MQITFYCAIPLYCTDWYQWSAAHNRAAEISNQLKELSVKCAIINLYHDRKLYDQFWLLFVHISEKKYIGPRVTQIRSREICDPIGHLVT